MNWSKFKVKKISSIYQVTNSYFFDATHNAGTYLKVIEHILNICDLLEGFSLSGYRYKLNKDNFTATLIRKYPLGDDIECVIDFKTTTLTIKVIE